MSKSSTKSSDSDLKSDPPVRLATLVDMTNPQCVLDETRITTRSIDPAFDFSPVERVFNDVVTLFTGNYPGYRACNTRYHDLNHTTDTLLAMVRLIHCAHTHGVRFRNHDIALGLISALMHDVGYIQDTSDRKGTGAKHALVHIARGVVFTRTYLGKNGYSTYDYRKCRAAILCTDLSLPIASIRFETRGNTLVGKILAAADLLGQTADRCYLEKLRFLYEEFAEADIRGYSNELELLQDSLDFNEFIKKRLTHDLDGIDRYLDGHFKTRWGIDRDLYRESINNNLNYLKYFLGKDPLHYTNFLRRVERQ